MTHKIIVDDHGFIRCIHNPDLPLHELGTVRLRRLSHITPAFAPIKGPAFWILRRLFGERGRVAQWTRTWNTFWMVKIIRCGEWSVFHNRADAVKWELQHFQDCEECKGAFLTSTLDDLDL